MSADCEHYQRHVDLYSPCCQQWWSCHVCHDEASDHELNRETIQTIRCRNCQLVQPLSNHCLNEDCVLFLKFDLYCCTHCALFNNNPDKIIHHCTECGICRLGSSEEIQHCADCNMCYNNTSFIGHQCRKNRFDEDCPICLQNLFKSRACPIPFKNCSHAMCSNCYLPYLQNQEYTCPICKKSIVDMTQNWEMIDQVLTTHTMPIEFSQYKSDILCNDCNCETTQVPFHFQYHKCIHCKSYNTSIIKTHMNTIME